MEKFNSRVVFLDSGNNVLGNGEKASWLVNNVDDFSVLGNNKVLKVCLTSFSMFKNFYNINETNGIFYASILDGAGTRHYIEIVIPKGDYIEFSGTPNALDVKIQQAIVNAGFTGAVVTWDAYLRKFTFDMSAAQKTQSLPGLPLAWNSNSDYFVCFMDKSGAPPTGVSQIGLYNDSWMILGARPVRDHTAALGSVANPVSFFPDTVAATYTSYYLTQLSSLDEIVIRTDLPSMNYQSSGYDKTASADFKLQQTNILARIPVNRSTYDNELGMIHYIDDNDTFCLTIGNTQISQFSLYLTDGRGRFLQEVSPLQALYGALSFRATLRFDYLMRPTTGSPHVPNTERYPINIGRG